jgi:hypothetical protein
MTDTPAVDDAPTGTDLVPVMSAAEQINAAHAEIVAAEAQRKTAQDRANAASGEVRRLDKSILKKHYEIGAMLIRQKDAVKHGKWGEWLKVNCPDVPWRRANEYMELARYQSGIVEFSNSRQFGSAAKLSVRGAQEIVAQLKPKKPLSEKSAADDDDTADDDGPTKELVEVASGPDQREWPLCSVTDPVVGRERQRMVAALARSLEAVGPSGARITVRDLFRTLLEVWGRDETFELYEIMHYRFTGAGVEEVEEVPAPTEQEHAAVQ